MRKRTASLLLTLALLLGLAPGFAAQTAQAADNDLWTDHAAATAPSTTTYNNETCYAIGSAEELAWFAEAVQSARPEESILSTSIVLTADIDMGAHLWTPIYRYANRGYMEIELQTLYKGNVYGAYHTISGINLAPLSVDYTFSADDDIQGAKAGDIWHTDEYGFVVTQGTVQDIRLNGIYLERQTAGTGLTEANVGRHIVTDNEYKVVLIYAATAVTRVEISNPQITANLGGDAFYYDMVQLVSSSKNGAVSNVYINGGHIHSTGAGSTWLIESCGKTTRNTVVVTDFISEEKEYSAIWRGDAEYSTMSNNYTNIDINQFPADELGERKPDRWFTAAQIANVLGAPWQVKNGELYFSETKSTTSGYTVALSCGKGGTAQLSRTQLEVGETTVLTIAPDAGYMLAGYTISPKGALTVQSDSGAKVVLELAQETNASITVSFQEAAAPDAGGWSFISGDDYQLLTEDYQVAVFTPDASFTAAGVKLGSYEVFRRVSRTGAVQYLAVVAAGETEQTLSAKLSGTTTANKELASSYGAAVRGDLDQNGVLNGVDRNFIIRGVYSLTPEEAMSQRSSWELLSADMDFNGKFNPMDIMTLARLIAG